MNTLVILASSAMAAAAPIVVEDGVEMALNRTLVDLINADEAISSWIAGENAFFEGMSMDQARKMLGTHMVGARRSPR